MKSHKLRAVLSCTLAVAMVATAIAAPWDNSQRLRKVSEAYDTSAVVTVSGTIVRIYEITPCHSPSYGFHMILKSAQETLNVHIGPGWYLKSLDGKLAAGDSVQVTGAMTKELVTEGNEKIRSLRAAEIQKGGATVLTLRDKNGKPVWRGY